MKPVRNIFQMLRNQFGVTEVSEDQLTRKWGLEEVLKVYVDKTRLTRYYPGINFVCCV